MTVLTRRRWIQASVASAALVQAGAVVAAPQRLVAVWSRVDLLLVDMRLTEAVSAMQGMGLQQVPVVALPRDVLPLWHDRLLPIVTAPQRRVIAGLTTARGLFALRTLAADHQLRLQFIAEFVPATSGTGGSWMAADGPQVDALHSDAALSWIISRS